MHVKCNYCKLGDGTHDGNIASMCFGPGSVNQRKFAKQGTMSTLAGRERGAEDLNFRTFALRCILKVDLRDTSGTLQLYFRSNNPETILRTSQGRLSVNAYPMFGPLALHELGNVEQQPYGQRTALL